jgi:hypothetical protein
MLANDHTKSLPKLKHQLCPEGTTPNCKAWLDLLIKAKGVKDRDLLRATLNSHTFSYSKFVFGMLKFIFIVFDNNSKLQYAKSFVSLIVCIDNS